MTDQNYCMVNEQTNVCDNVILWDGNLDTWSPPNGYLLLVQSSTQAKNWVWNPTSEVWELVVDGFGGIGYTWDGTYLVTSEPEPPMPVQPVVDGAQTL